MWRAETAKGAISAPTVILATNGLAQALGFTNPVLFTFIPMHP